WSGQRVHATEHTLAMVRGPPTSALFPYTTLFRSLTMTRSIEGKPISRRSFIRKAAVAAAGPAILSRSMFGRTPPSDTILVGCVRSEEHTSELQSRENLVCRLLLEKKKQPQSRGSR